MNKNLHSEQLDWKKHEQYNITDTCDLWRTNEFMYKYEIFEYQNALPRANPIIINLQVTQTLCSIISCAIFPERITSANNFNSNPVILKEFKSSAKRQIFRLSVEVIYVRPGVLKIGSDHAEAQPINLKWKKGNRPAFDNL